MSFRENVSKFSISLANHICFRPQHNIAGWTLHRDVGRSAADDRPLDPAVGRVLYGCRGKLPTAYGARCNICGWAAVFKVIKFCLGYSNIRAGLQLQMSELLTLKREKARQRQIKSRLKNQVLTASPVYVPRQRRIKRCVESELLNASPITGCSFPVPSTLMTGCCPSGRCALCGNEHANEILCPPVNSFEFYSSVQISEPHLRNICWKCSAQHDSDMQCVCVRCHYLHPDSDCPSKKYRSVANHHYRITSGRCALCGNPHGDDVQCPPVNSFEFYYSDHISLLELPQPDICIMCSAQHDSDMPCLCVRCHTRHPDADCPIALELPDDHQSVLLSGRMHICRICSLRHSHNESCRCVICHSRHPLGDCPRVPVQRCWNTSVNAAVRSLALTVNVDNTEAHSCGSMSIVCPHCRSRSWKHERLNCCNDGQINVPQLNVVPAELSDLILSSHVRSNFRIYNSVMALASVGHSNKSVIGGTFVLGGSAYHRIGSLIPGATCVAAVYASLILALQANTKYTNLPKYIY